MLNELYQVVTALEEKGVSFSLPHPSLEPMKNVALMVVRLASGGKPAQLEMLKGDEAERIFRIKHASSGSSFPGINIPLPLRDLTGAPFAESSQGLETLIRLLSQKSASAGTIGDAARALSILWASRPSSSSGSRTLPSTQPPTRKTVKERPGCLFPRPGPKTRVSLWRIWRKNPTRWMIDLLFGSLDWKGRTEPLGSRQYFRRKVSRMLRGPVRYHDASVLEGDYEARTSQVLVALS